MLHTMVLAAHDNVEAAGFILRGIKGIFVAIGSIIAAVICGVVAAMKGRNPLELGHPWPVLQHHHADRHHRDSDQANPDACDHRSVTGARLASGGVVVVSWADHPFDPFARTQMTASDRVCTSTRRPSVAFCGRSRGL